MDAQIWYAIFSTFFGGIYGAFRRLGEVSNIFFFILLIIHCNENNSALFTCLFPQSIIIKNLLVNRNAEYIPRCHCSVLLVIPFIQVMLTYLFIQGSTLLLRKYNDLVLFYAS